MDLVTLDPAFQFVDILDNYDSLIWTERFNRDVGDFQLTTGRVSYFLDKLPAGMRVALRDSDVVMEVETHLIERKKNAPEKLTIKGRAFESILDRRVSVKSLTDVSEWKVNVKTPSDLAYFIINQICVEGILDPLDIFPDNEVEFLIPDDFLESVGPVKEFVVNRGVLLNTVMELLRTEAPSDISTTPITPKVAQRGLRSVRPSTTGARCYIEIYKGTDKSSDVFFDATRQLLDNGNYLFNTSGSGNVAYLMGRGLSAKMQSSSGSAPLSGFARRTFLVDATSSGISTVQTLREQGHIALSEKKAVAIFDGSINEDLSPYTYGVDYGLGDLVLLVGDYGIATKARVSEFIRSQDATGYKAYPTLETIANVYDPITPIS